MAKKELELTPEEAKWLNDLAATPGLSDTGILARLVQRIYAAADKPERPKLDCVRCPVCGFPTDYYGCSGAMTGGCKYRFLE